MTTDKEQGKTAQGMVIGGVGGTLLGALAATIAALLAKAAEAKELPPDEKLNYLIDCLTALIPVLAQVAESNAQLLALLQQWLAAQGVAPPAEGVPPAEGIEVTVKTAWVAKEPEEIYRFVIRTTGTFYSSKMVDWTRGKRLLVKVESSLDKEVQIQLIGNIVDDMELATDIDTPKACPANDNISIGPAWDDWCPYIGVKIVVDAALVPTKGLLTISAVSQE
ncbi:hypothetical protein ES705_49637 [subsurface metagenome]